MQIQYSTVFADLSIWIIDIWVLRENVILIFK